MYKKIAAAVAFSPRMDAILSEVSRLQKLFEGELILIHVGDETEEKRSVLLKSLQKANIEAGLTQVFWETGDPAKKIKSVCKKQKVDLLVAGALQTENIFKYYIGSVARKILRKAQCSVLVLIDPTLNPTPFQKIVIHAGDDNDAKKTISTGCYIGQRDHAKQLHILREIKMFGFTMALAGEDPEHEYSETRRKIMQEKIAEVKGLMADCPCEGLKINIKIVTGKSGFELSKFTRSAGADLLIVDAPKRDLNIFDRMFPNDLEYILADLPGNLLLVQAD